MVKRFITEVVFYIIIAMLVIGISGVAGYVISILMSIATGIVIEPYRIGCICLVIFLLISLVDIYIEFIERLKKGSN